MSFIDIFRQKKNVSMSAERWRELGQYTAIFSRFGTDMYKSDLVRACIRPLAEHTSKANARCTNKNIEYVLNTSPNMYMNGKAFLSKVRTRLELQNTVFIYIVRDIKGHACGFYPVPYNTFEALEYENGLFIKFTFVSGQSPVVLPWDDLAVLRKDYNTSDIAGDPNTAILSMLELINTTNQGIANAVKATANLRGILKSTKAMLSMEDVKKNKEQFVADYLNLENEGGIASLDATMEFTPISMNPTITSWEQQKEFREDVYRYFGISEAIVSSNYTEEQMEAFYDSRIEPFLVELSTELTKKVFTPREQAFGAQVIYESNRLQYSSNKTKLAMVQMVDRGALTPNEWRMMFNMAPVEGGDTPLRRLDTTTVDKIDTDTKEADDGSEE